jgi:hypothetical protein
MIVFALFKDDDPNADLICKCSISYQVRHYRLITVQAHDFELKHLNGAASKGDVGFSVGTLI